MAGGTILAVRGLIGGPSHPAARGPPALTAVHGDDRPVVLREAGEAGGVLGRWAIERRLVHLCLLHWGRDACVGEARGSGACGRAALLPGPWDLPAAAPAPPSSSHLWAVGRGPLAERSKWSHRAMV